MQNAIIPIFCHVDDFLKTISWNDEPQYRMTLAEVITVGLVSWRFFQDNLELARVFLHEYGYISNILNKSRLNRRFHDVPSFFWHLIVAHLAYQVEPYSKGFLIDSFSVSVCHNVHSNRLTLFKGQKYIGYSACKQAWFTGRVFIDISFDSRFDSLQKNLPWISS